MSSRRNSQIETPPSRKSLNIIDFILKQNFQEKIQQQVTISQPTLQDENRACQRCQQIEENLQNYVSFDRFQEVIENLWQRVKNGHNENKKFNDRIGKLEKIIQEYFYHERQSQQQQVIMEYDEEQQVDADMIERFQRKLLKENATQMKAIEENVSKLVGKEVQNKYIILNEKLEEMDNRFVHFEEQIQILSHKCALTREECTDRINSIQEVVKQNNDLMRTNNNGLGELQQHYVDMEDDILKIFQHIKSLLNIDYKVSENESSMVSLKSQVNQMRNAVNDLSDYARAQFTLMNQNNRMQTFNSPKHTNNEVQSLFQTSSTQFSQFQLDNHIIHSSQASFLVWRQSPASRKLQARGMLQTQTSQKGQNTNQTFTVTGMPKLKKPRTQGNQTTFFSVPKTQIDSKLKRQMSESSKKNFLHFLLIQKAGQKDEKSFYDFLKKTYNFETPQEQHSLSKKGIPYLHQREENDDQIKKMTQNILSVHKKSHYREVPLDKYVSEMYEQQLRRYPKTRERLELSQS